MPSLKVRKSKLILLTLKSVSLWPSPPESLRLASEKDGFSRWISNLSPGIVLSVSAFVLHCVFSCYVRAYANRDRGLELSQMRFADHHHRSSRVSRLLQVCLYSRARQGHMYAHAPHTRTHICIHYRNRWLKSLSSRRDTRRNFARYNNA